MNAAPPTFHVADQHQPHQLYLFEELVTLILNDQTGCLEVPPGWPRSCAMTGAIIADLALAGRIDTDLEKLFVIDPSPIGDKLLDSVLADIVASSEDNDTQYWVEYLAAHSDDIAENTLKRLFDKGIIDYTHGGFFTLSQDIALSGVYPSQSEHSERAARIRTKELILGDEIPDPRDSILVSLLHSIDGLKHLLDPEDLKGRHERIELITDISLIGRTVAAAIKESVGRPKLRRLPPSKPMAKVPIVDLVRQRDLRLGNIPKGMFEISQKHGPVVALPFKVHGMPLVAAIGAEANKWVDTYGRYYLRTKDHIQGLERTVGAGNSIPGMDGADHFRMRREMQHAYTGPAFRDRLPEAIYHCRRSLERWQVGDIFRATQTMEDLIGLQSSHLLVNVDCSSYARELIEFEHRALATEGLGAMPKFMLSTPKMRRYRRRVHQLRRSVMEVHTPAQRRNKPGDIADAVLALHQKDPQFLPETDMAFWFVFSMAAAIYLGSGLGFVFVILNQRPDLHELVYKEAESVFGDGAQLDVDEFTAEKFDTTRRVFLESARLYPTFPIQLRKVMNDCAIEGYEIPKDCYLLTCQGASHYDSKLFKEPLEIDINRYLPERAEHRTRGAYVRFGLGTHACLGRNYAELQMIMNIMLIAYHFRLETVAGMDPLRIKPAPTSSPSKRLKFRVAEILNPV